MEVAKLQDFHANQSAEASSFFPDLGDYNIGPDKYLDHLRAAKEAVSIPIIASLNGTTPGGWTGYAKKIENAGADALELNTYYLASDATESGSDVEKRTLDSVASVKEAVSIPIAVKLSPFFSSLANLAKQLKEKADISIKNKIQRYNKTAEFIVIFF